MKNIICIITILLFLFTCSSGPGEKPVIKNGFIDVRDWNFKKNGNIALRGNWKFQWMNYDDAYLNEEYNTSEWNTIYVPSFWNNKKDIPAEGFGCLRLIIKTNYTGCLGIYLKSCLSAYDLYVNKEKVMTAGIFGYDQKSSIPRIKAAFIKIKPETCTDSQLDSRSGCNTITMVWRISNYYSSNGGPESVPIIGDYDTLKRELWLEDTIRFIITGIILMMIVFNSLLWIKNRKDTHTILYALFLFLLLIKSLLFNDFFVNILSHPGTFLFDLQYKVYFLAEILGFSFLSNCLGSLFPGETNKIIRKGTTILLLSISGFILLFNAKQNVLFSIIYDGVTLITAIWLLYILITGIIRKREGAFILFFGFLILVITVFNDILFFRRIIYTLFLSDAGSVICSLSQLIMIITAFTRNPGLAEHLSGNLQEEVRNRIKELEAANKQIEQKSEQKTMFFINFAHEIKTPLTIIQNSLNEYIKKTKLTDELKIIKVHINKLRSDIVNLLDLRKIEENILFYNTDTIIDASQTLVCILNQFKALARSNRIQLTFSGEDALFLKIDPYAFERIINNIIDNAIKYTEENGHIDVHLTSDRENIIVTVKDDGIGISREQQKNIFLPYYQVSKEKQNIQGMGLGLYIVKNVLDSFNGKIRIESELHKGTTVTIVLPRHITPGSASVTDFIPRQPALDGIDKRPLEYTYDKDKPTVFIVEDNINLISFIQKSMSVYFNVLYATDGKKGLKKLNMIPKPDIIISDIMMDTMDGHEFYNKLMTIERLRDIPFIFLTAKIGREEKIQSLKKGVIDYIYKPFDKEELIEKVKSILKNRRAHTESEIRKMEKRLSSLLRTNDDDEFLSFEKKCRMYSISPREKEVLRELLVGMQIKEIAGKLFLSVHTVRNHIRHIYDKCKVQNRVELINLINSK
ncbi:MAG: response regulator [Spirochaetales bacterium]|nr:response regulator [Spirochaetales bacterium]